MANQAEGHAGDQVRLGVSIADRFVQSPVPFSFDLAFGIVEHAIPVAQAVFPFSKIAPAVT